MEVLLFLAYGYIFFWLGIFFWIGKLILEECSSFNVPVLLYHRLILEEQKEKDCEKVYVNLTSDFEKQMDYLHQENFQVISMDEYLNYRQSPENLPLKPIIITFDDGFQSNYTLAYPILKKYDFPGTIFVTTYLDANNFKEYAHLDSPLSPQELDELSKNKISIESHGHSHCHLTTLSPKKLEEELSLPKEILEKITQKKVSYIANPYGASNKSVQKALQKQGYLAGFSGKRGRNSLATPIYDLRRIVVERYFTLEDFAQALTFKGVVRDKILGFVRKDLPFFFLGEKITAWGRKILYGSFLAFLMKPVMLRLVVGILGIVSCILLGLSLWFVMGS